MVAFTTHMCENGRMDNHEQDSLKEAGPGAKFRPIEAMTEQEEVELEVGLGLDISVDTKRFDLTLTGLTPEALVWVAESLNVTEQLEAALRTHGLVLAKTPTAETGVAG